MNGNLGPGEAALWELCLLGMAFGAAIFYAFMRTVLNDWKREQK